MYKRKFSKAKTTVEDTLLKSTNASVVGAPSVSSIFDDDEESVASPPMLDDFSELPVEKKKKIDSNSNDSTDYSEPLFTDDDTHSYLKQTLLSCGLQLNCDQNILCTLFIYFC